jgi:hypothetical protein
MLETNYYCLVSSLPELIFQQSKLPYALDDFKEYLKSELSDGDFRMIELFFAPYDNRNLLNLLEKNKQPFNAAGNIPLELVEAALKTKEQEPVTEMPDTQLGYIQNFVIHYQNQKPLYPNLSWEDQLTAYYYEFVLKNSSNPFILKWFRFEQSLKNFTIGLNSKNHGFTLDDKIIGDNEVTQAIKTSKTKDFGLVQDYSYLTTILNAYEEQDLLGREKQIDMVRWNYLEELVTFHYFSNEKIMAYLIKLNIIERWINLDAEKGKKDFERLVNELQNSYEFPKDFIIDGAKK